MALSYLKAAFVAAFAATAAIAMPMQQAKAMDLGRCFERAALLQKLEEEGQQVVVFANEPLVTRNESGYESESRLFTSNATGSVGYIIGGNKPKEVGATQGCVKLRLTDVTILDARVAGVDPKALLKTEDPATALSECKEAGAGRCNVHSRFLASQDRDGYRVMMQAHIAELQPDGKTYAKGDLVTLTGQMEGRQLGTWAITSPAGAYTIARAYTDIAYAPYAIKVLDERRRSHGPMDSDRRTEQR
jgi:hypothetical protein